jgi:trigger factor
VNVPGFRKGHVPARIIDQRLGRGMVLEEAMQDAVPRFYSLAVEQSEVRPLGQPQVEVNELPEGTTGDLKFTAEVDVRPEITLPDLDSVPVTVDDLAVGDEDVDARVQTLRERFGTLIPVERPAADGDFVTIDIAATIGDDEIDSVKGVSYQVGAGTMLAGMDEALAGLSAGETTTFDSELAGGERAGEQAHVIVTLAAVKERQLPELDDDFAQLASEFDTLEDLRADLRGKTEESRRFEQGLQARDRLLEHLLESVEVPVPEGLVAEEVRRHLEGEDRLEDDEHRAEVEVESRKALKTQLLLDAIAEKEQVAVGQAELIEYIVSSAQQYGMDPNAFAKAVDEAGQVPAMVGEVARRKGLVAVLGRATVSDVSGQKVDLDAFLGLGENADAAPDGLEPATAAPVQAGSGAIVVADPTAVPLSDLGGFEPDEPGPGA